MSDGLVRPVHRAISGEPQPIERAASLRYGSRIVRVRNRARLDDDDTRSRRSRDRDDDDDA
jgi:hypothetical protein